MTDQVFGRRQHGSALEQLLNLRDMTRRTPAEVAPEAVVNAVEASPVEAFAAGAQAEAPVAAQAATEYVDDAAHAAAGVVGNDPDALARAAAEAAAQGVADPAYAAAANQVVDVTVQPRLIVQGQHGPIVVPIDVPVAAAQPRVTIAAPTAVVVDPATGQVIANQAAGAAAAPVAAEPVSTSLRERLRSVTADDIGAIFGGRGVQPPAVAAEVPVVAAPPAGEVAEQATRPSLLDQVRGAFTNARGATPAAAEVAGEVVEAAPAAAKPSLLDQLRAAGSQLRGPAAAGAAEVADVAPDAVAASPKGLAAIREGLSGLGALRHAPAREAVEEVVEHAPSLADRALDALKLASKVK